MLGCLHCWHTGQESADERGLVERQPENTLTSRLLLTAQAPSARKGKKKEPQPCLRSGDSATQEERPTDTTSFSGATLERKGKVKTQTTAITTRRKL